MFSLALATVNTTSLHQTAAETVKENTCPLFRTNLASDSLLESFQVSGYNGSIPGRKTWNFDQAQDRLRSTTGPSKCEFSLKAVEHRDWRLAKSDYKKRGKGIDPLAPEAPPISEQRASLRGSMSQPNLMARTESSLSATESGQPPLTRADRYYQALLKAEKSRTEAKRKVEWEEYLSKSQKAAEKAKKQAMKAERRLLAGKKETESLGSHSDSDSESGSDDEEYEDPGPVQPYPGVMKVEVEVVVLRAPGADKSETESSVDDRSTHTPSSASEADHDDAGADWAAELQALQEEFGDKKEKVESEPESDLDLGARRIGNVHDANDKRTALGLGGTAFFVPEVERYAHAPSLLPPPPRGEGHVQQIGNKRLKLKPRLPLEVSRGRWRDEHPYGCPPEELFRPDLDDMRTFEEKVRRVELYGTLNKLISHMPKPDGLRKLPATDDFERELDKELKDSLAWKQYIKRQRLIEIARAERDKPPPTEEELLREAQKTEIPDPFDAFGAGVIDDVASPSEASRPKSKKEGKTKQSPPVPPHPGAPPLKLAGPPAFQVGKVIGSKSSPLHSPHSRSQSPPSGRGTGLMSVAPGVRRGA